MTALPLGSHKLGVRLETRVAPRASRNRIGGVRDGRLLVAVTAPPVDHEANVAVVALVADALGVPKRDIHIVAGTQSRSKSLVVTGLTATELQSRILPYLKL